MHVKNDLLSCSCIFLSQPSIHVEELEAIRKLVYNRINSVNELQLEYFEIVETSSLRAVSAIRPNTPLTACIAVHAGTVRLIDNVELIS